MLTTLQRWLTELVCIFHNLPSQSACTDPSSKWPCSSSCPESIARLISLDFWAPDLGGTHPPYDCSIRCWIPQSSYRCYSLRRNSHPFSHRIRSLHHRLYSLEASAENKGVILVGLKRSNCSGRRWIIWVRDEWCWCNGGDQENLDRLGDRSIVSVLSA